MHHFNKEIGRKIKIKRNEMGFKQEFLASELGISQSALSRIENGTDDVAIVTLIKLSLILKTNFSYFIPVSVLDDAIKTNIDWVKNMEEMLAKSESLIKHHDSIIKQQAENYK